MTQSAPLLLEPDAGTPGGDAAARAEVQEVVRGFSRALRTHLLYEGQSPALDKFVESLRARMGALWDRLPYLNVQVEEREIVWQGTAVYVGEERDNLAFLLYKDGVRELSFMPGFEEEDLDGFLAILARIHRLKLDEEDLLTLLWDHDWGHFRYRYVEPLSEGVKLPEPGEASRQTQTAAAPQDDPAPVQSITTEDFREALYFLDEVEMRRLEAEVQREMRRDLWTDVLNAMFDRLEDGAAHRQSQVVSITSDVLPTLLGAGRLETAAYMLGELVKVATSGRQLPPAVVRAMRGLFDQLARPETVAELVRIVEESGDALPREHLGALLAYFPPESLGPLLRAGEGSASEAARAALLNAAERLAAPNPGALRAFVLDADPSIAAGAARLVGRLRVSEAGPDVARLLTRPEARVRVAAIEALQELRSPTASGALEGALDDEEREVRVAAVRALAALRWAPAKGRLEAALDSRRLREADLTERIAFFEAYGQLAGAEAVGVLDRILNGKSWLGRRESGEMRACAALGLGRVRHPGAEKSLAAAAADADPVVRSAVGRALRALKT
ncbi:HEAT repeat domain-containing protein [Longimicrobium sp.]|uniref:HEAT repeat domain-containing protein n=1 Tax=Longimicrobium sp. TaxID=2029185 RepID=UPI002E3109F7|nr:HEAT repeat domain-containing protein [Longimicrobium sp.]HEX6039778.1 HEAT repeat domain-containing protein [Longimicrobium sp.]